HPVAHRAGAAVAEVDVGAVAAGGESEGGDVGSADAVEVVGRRHARGQRGGEDLNLVGAGVEVAEGVVAVTAGGRRGDLAAVDIEKADGDAVDAGLTRVLDTVGIGVAPDPVADGGSGGRAVAEIDVDVTVVGGRQGPGDRLGDDVQAEPARGAEVRVLAVGADAQLEGRHDARDVDDGARVVVDTRQGAGEGRVVVPGGRIDRPTVLDIGVRQQLKLRAAVRRSRGVAAELDL